jgi:ABC-type polar amino acid transport system ATPase subunit
MDQSHPNKPTLLEAREVSKRRGTRWILRSVNLRLHLGECVGILGPSGCGKTTLLRGLLGFETFDEGQVQVNGTTRSSLELKEPGFRRSFGFVTQANNLWPYRTALENVAEGLIYGLHRPSDAARTLAQRWLDRLGVGQHALKYPAELSGGEQQRVSIARALAIDPKALLLDEPTSGLDPLTAGELSELLLLLRKEGGSFLIVSHQIDLLRRMCDRVYFMHDGRVLETGKPNETLTNPQSAELVKFIATVRLGW